MIDLKRTQQYTDVIHGIISYSGLEGAIISTPIFNRLHRILQSSLLYLTYSSNKVKRFEHCVGTMFLAGEILYHSVSNTSDQIVLDQLVDEMRREIVTWYKGVDVHKEKLLDNSIADKFTRENILDEAKAPSCVIYKKYFPNNLSRDNEFAYTVLFEATRLAGLLHDVGHLPYSHVFEYATKQLYAMIDELDNRTKAQESFLDIMEDYFRDDKELHEEIGIALLKQIKTEISEELTDYENREELLFVAVVFDFAEKILKSKDTENTVFSDLHKIIAGILDADRLDYCSRDAFCAGVRKDIFPYQKLLSTYKIILQDLDIDHPAAKDDENVRKRIMFSPALKNITEIEDLLDRRWMIFTKMNYHHRVHKHEIIFSEILAKIGFDELEELNRVDKDADIPYINPKDALALKVYNIWSIIRQLQENNRSIDYLIIQLDDSWMDTLLKTAFFEKYESDYRNYEKLGNDYFWNMFDELIAAKKHYLSCYKRSAEFTSFDNKMGKSWLEKNESVLSDDDKKATIEYKIAKIIKKKLDEGQNNEEKAFYLNIITGSLTKSAEIFFYQKVEDKINTFLKNGGDKKTSIVHCLIRPCNFSLGCYNNGAPVYLWQKHGETKRFEHISLKNEHLKQLKKACLPFHLYYLPLINKNYESKVDIEQLEDELIKIMVEVLPEYYENVT